MYYFLWLHSLVLAGCEIPVIINGYLISGSSIKGKRITIISYATFQYRWPENFRKTSQNNVL